MVTAEQEREGLDAQKAALMPRKHRKVYESFQRRKKVEQAKVAALEGKRAKLALAAKRQRQAAAA